MRSIKPVSKLYLMAQVAFFLFFATGHSTHYEPWLTSPLQIQSQLLYLHENATQVQSPQGSFKTAAQKDSLWISSALTLWPSWNLEAEVFFSHTADIDFSYEATMFTLRYACLDDICCDYFSLVTGATLSLPNKQFLRQFSYLYHGLVNLEFHATVGKEWAYQTDWVRRLWVLVGYGFADRGSPWMHGLITVEYKPSPGFKCGLYSEAIYGFGSHDISQHFFKGYASINHQSIDLGAFMLYDTSCYGELSCYLLYNIHARNFVEHYWAISLSWLFSFSLLDLIY